jgi:hypothetical protein
MQDGKKGILQVFVIRLTEPIIKAFEKSFAPMFRIYTAICGDSFTSDVKKARYDAMADAPTISENCENFVPVFQSSVLESLNKYAQIVITIEEGSQRGAAFFALKHSEHPPVILFVSVGTRFRAAAERVYSDCLEPALEGPLMRDSSIWPPLL